MDKTTTPMDEIAGVSPADEFGIGASAEPNQQTGEVGLAAFLRAKVEGCKREGRLTYAISVSQLEEFLDDRIIVNKLAAKVLMVQQAQPQYELSDTERGILNKTLMKSVKVIEPQAQDAERAIAAPGGSNG